jgi:cytochrome c-type biogenesis protein CcmH/NrfG
LRWDPVTAAEVADDTRLETSAVSTQLTRLVRQGLLEKADPGDSKKALYQVAERFFNIWYLMRASRRVRAKLRWFVEFLRVFFDPGKLKAMAQERLERFRAGGKARAIEIETAFACILASGADPEDYEEYLLRECPEKKAEWLLYLELPSSAVGSNDISRGTAGGQAPDALKPESSTEIQHAIAILTDYLHRLESRDLDPAERQKREIEVEAAIRKAIESSAGFSGAANSLLGIFLSQNPARIDEAEAACRLGIALDPSAVSWDALGCVLRQTPGREDEAEAVFRTGIELHPNSASLWKGLGDVLTSMAERENEAEAAYREAIKLDPGSAQSWNNLGVGLARTDRFEEAEDAFRTANNLEPTRLEPWLGLGAVLARNAHSAQEAEAAFRKATALDPGSARAWLGIAAILVPTPERTDETEDALRVALKLDPSHFWWSALALLIMRKPGREADAESAIRRGLELAPGSVLVRVLLIVVLRAQGRTQEAEGFLQGLKGMNLDDFPNPRKFFVMIYCETPERDQAIAVLRTAHRLDPADPILEAILATCDSKSVKDKAEGKAYLEASRQSSFWDELLGYCDTYPSFAGTLLSICDLVPPAPIVSLHRAVALAQAGDFPRAIVALDDALTGDPIEQLAAGKRALEVFFAAAVRNGRVEDCLELIDKKEWKDAWRPIYEALRAVSAGSVDYLKRVAVEIREPATIILGRIAPELPGLPGKRLS